MRNRKGLDAVVTTLIIILLVLVAIGIIWVVVRNVIEGGAGQIDISTKCIQVDLSAEQVINNGGGSYDVTIKRNAGGDGAIGGIKVTLFDDTAGTNSGVLDFGAAPNALETVTRTLATGVASANRLEYTAYFLDDSGTEQLCSQTSTFNF